MKEKERTIGRTDLSKFFKGTSSSIRPHHALWSKPPNYLASVFFERYTVGNTWEPIGKGSRVDVDKKVFLDDLSEEAGIMREELNRQFGGKVAVIVGVTMSQWRNSKILEILGKELNS